jgi:hypothetical protein
MYAENGAIPSRKPLSASDIYLGCILASSVSPPHDAGTIKQYIYKVEKITAATASSLYMTPSDQTPIDDEAHVAIVACAGPGSVPDTPLALVFKLTTTDIAARKMPVIRKLKAWTKPSPPMDPQYRRCPVLYWNHVKTHPRQSTTGYIRIKRMFDVNRPEERSLILVASTLTLLYHLTLSPLCGNA